jgi:hypothetical protein
MCCNGNSFFVLKTFFKPKTYKVLHSPSPAISVYQTFLYCQCVCVRVRTNVKKSLCSFSSGKSLGLVDCIIYRRADITYLCKYQNYAFSVLVVSCSLKTKCYWNRFQSLW